MHLINDLRSAQEATLFGVAAAAETLRRGDPEGAQVQLDMLLDVMTAIRLELPTSVEANPTKLVARILYVIRHYRVLFGDWGFHARIQAAKARSLFAYQAPEGIKKETP